MNNTEQEGEQAFALNKAVTDNEMQRRMLLSKNIAHLKVLKKDNLFRVILGDEKADWSAYLGQIETMYSRNEIYNYMRVHDKFVDDLKLSFVDICDIPLSRLIELIPIVEDGNVDNMLDQARVLTSQDFKDTIRQIKGLPTSDDGHEHKMVTYEICAECGVKHKIGEHDTTKSVS